MATDDHDPATHPPPPPPPAPVTDGRARADGRAPVDGQPGADGRTPADSQPGADGQPPADSQPGENRRTPATDRAATTAATTTAGGRASRDVNRTGIVLTTVVVALVVVALIAVVLRRDPAQLDLATPEGTVQAYLQSVVDGQPRPDLLDPTVDCEAPTTQTDDQDRVRAVVLDSTIDGDRATVELAVTESSGSGPFDDGYTHEEGYELRRNGAGWVIAAYDWPWSAGGYCWNDRMGLGS